MYNRLRRIFVALGVALPLIVVVPASHGIDVIVGPPAPAQIHIWYNLGYLICGVNLHTNTGFARIFPPDGTNTQNRMWWVAAVHHFDASGAWQYWEWTDWFYYEPPGLIAGGGWFAYTNPNLSQWIVAAYPFGWVYLQTFFLDEATQHWLADGRVFEPGCYVVNIPANPNDFDR